MKLSAFVFSLLIVISGKLFSQDTAAVKPNKIYDVYGGFYLYNKKVMKDKEVFLIMKSSSDKEIMTLVDKSKKSKQLKRIGYLGIPAAFGAIYFMEKGIKGAYNRNGTTDYKKKNAFKNEALLCLAAVIAFPTISVILNSKYERTKAKAIKLYNEK